MSPGEAALRAAAAFRTAGAPRRAEPLGSGHIHDTFSVACEGPDGPVRYVIQRINTRVFPDPDAVIGNAALITRVLARAEGDRPDAARRRLRCLPTRQEGLAYRDPEGGIWRGFDRIEGARTYDSVASPEQARRAARAFGEFAVRLRDLDPAELRIPIPGFHDFAGRVEAFEGSVERDAAGRGAEARADVARAREAVGRLCAELPPERLAALPVRVVHNDCKLNNVLFDEESGEALCVIDLDTVMPGSLLFDFGDLVRTAACREPEDSRALQRVKADPELYRALAAGYLEGAGPLLSKEERTLLPLAGPLISLETGLRFLADHLAGDTYFRVTREGHNLDRARTQLRLAVALLDDLSSARRWIGA